jgi:chromate reductase
MFTILGIAGSLRRESYNRALMRAAADLVPPDTVLEIYEGLAGIPPYNEDVRLSGNPDVVQDLKDRVRAADALLIISPEYNYGIPGVLKNAIDWVSRADGEVPTPLRHKPTAIAGAAPGNFGTVRMQNSLRQTLLFTETPVLQKPELFVFRAAERFDERGHLTDETTRSMLRALLAELVVFAERVARTPQPAHVGDGVMP